MLQGYDRHVRWLRAPRPENTGTYAALFFKAPGPWFVYVGDVALPRLGSLKRVTSPAASQNQAVATAPKYKAADVQG